MLSMFVSFRLSLSICSPFVIIWIRLLDHVIQSAKLLQCISNTQKIVPFITHASEIKGFWSMSNGPGHS